MSRHTTPTIQRLARVFSLLAFSLVFSTAAFANADEMSAHKVKALMLLQMQKFLSAGNPPHAIRNICYYEEDVTPTDESVGQIIHAAVKANPDRFKNLAVTRYDALKSFSDCDLLYIPNSADSNLRNILTAVSGKPIVTVSAIKRFIYRGGMIGFNMDSQNHVKIEGNIGNMTQVRADPQLLEVMAHIEN